MPDPVRLSVAVFTVVGLAACAVSDSPDLAGGAGSTGPISTIEPTVPASIDAAARDVASTTAPPSTDPRPSDQDASPDTCAGPPTPRRTEAYRAVDGVAQESLSLDVYGIADASGCPAIVFVHGGGWRQGDKRGAGAADKAAWANADGRVFVSVNYRLAADPERAMWPVMGDDVAAAVAWVVDHAGELGIDPERIGLMGHSAGAHLAAIVATHPDLLVHHGHDRSVVSCLVALDSAKFDLTRDLPRADANIVANAFGDDPAVLADGSPKIQATEPGAPLADALLVTRGAARRQADTQAFADALESGGSADVTVHDASPLDHAQVNRNLGLAGDTTITPTVEAFLDRCLG
jgi:acetyl esterase/lipase